VVLSKPVQKSLFRYNQSAETAFDSWFSACEACENVAVGDDAKKRIWKCPDSEALEEFKINLKTQEYAKIANHRIRTAYLLQQASVSNPTPR
jgi:hypothetical protein